MSSAAATASSTVVAGLPLGTGTSWRANSCFPWYSSRSIGAFPHSNESRASGSPADRAWHHPRAMAIPKQISFVTFDVYGTLIDWETGVYDAFHKEAERDGFTLEREELIPLFHEIQ